MAQTIQASDLMNAQDVAKALGLGAHEFRNLCGAQKLPAPDATVKRFTRPTYFWRRATVQPWIDVLQMAREARKARRDLEQTCRASWAWRNEGYISPEAYRGALTDV